MEKDVRDILMNAMGLYFGSGVKASSFTDSAVKCDFNEHHSEPYQVSVLEYVPQYGYAHIETCDADGPEEKEGSSTIPELCRMYLFPMTAIDKEIEINGEKFKMTDKLNAIIKRNGGNGTFTNEALTGPMNHYGTHVDYGFMTEVTMLLIENHFDVLGLVPQKLALDAYEHKVY